MEICNSLNSRTNTLSQLTIKHIIFSTLLIIFICSGTKIIKIAGTKAVFSAKGLQSIIKELTLPLHLSLILPPVFYSVQNDPNLFVL